MHKSARTPLIRLIPLVILAFGAGCATVNVQRILGIMEAPRFDDEDTRLTLFR